MLDPALTFKFKNRLAGTNSFALIEHGIETIALRSSVASQFGTTAGLLVVFVDPSTTAFAAGVRPGDVIQSINGKPVTPFRRPFSSPNQSTTLTFEIVRNKEKHTITVNPPEKK
jgi:S1-C subfamily serine protease